MIKVIMIVVVLVLLLDSEHIQGEIKKTNWKRQESKTSCNLYGVKFINAKNGWAVGDSGVILYTSNGGRTWVTQKSNSRATLNDVSFINSKIGWVVGGSEPGSTLFLPKYQPRIENPQRQLSPPAMKKLLEHAPLYYYYIRNGGPSTVLHTLNGGITWEHQSVPTNLMIRAVEPIDEQNVWIVTAAPHHDPYGHLIFTSSGGSNWHFAPTQAGRALYDIVFVDSKNGWAVGSTGLIPYCTSESVKARKGMTHDTIRISDTIRLKGKTWIRYVPQLGEKGGAVIHTSDGGKTWSAQPTGISEEIFLLSVCFIDSINGWAVGESGTILHTHDGGKTWESQKSNTKNCLRDVDFVTKESGWIVGDKGLILRTADGGNTWIAEKGIPNYNLNAVAFPDPEHGWVVGDKGVILRYGRDN